MQKESKRFVDSCVFEGMTSIRTLIRAYDSGINDRKIKSILYDIFALSTILGWAYYGEVSVGYLFKNHSGVAIGVYRIIYVVFVFVGAVAEINIVWLVADCFNALMALPNLIALVALSGVVVKITREYFLKKHI